MAVPSDIRLLGHVIGEVAWKLFPTGEAIGEEAGLVGEHDVEDDLALMNSRYELR